MLCASALLAVAEPAPKKTHTTAGYFEGKQIVLSSAEMKRGRLLVVGDTVLGPLVGDRTPNDHRPNLYVISPGTQHQQDGSESINFNLLVNTLPHDEEPVEWDVYWALTLDPQLQSDFNSENALLLAAQETFTPNELFDFSDVPAANLLREYLHIDSVAGMERFRRDDGRLPRVIIVPAGLAVRASAVDPEAPPVERETRISRAWSHLSHHSKSGTQTAEKK